MRKKTTKTMKKKATTVKYIYRTTDPEQLKAAIKIVDRFHQRLGLKMSLKEGAVHFGTGDMVVEDYARMWNMLKQSGISYERIG